MPVASYGFDLLVDVFTQARSNFRTNANNPPPGVAKFMVVAKLKLTVNPSVFDEHMFFFRKKRRPL
jgi:hypothetical protein